VDFAAGGMDTSDEVGVIEKLASLDYIDGVITNVPREASYKSSSLAERKKAVIAALDTFVGIPEKYAKPIITQKLMPSEISVEFLRSASIPMCDTPHQCALAMYALTRYARIRSRPRRTAGSGSKSHQLDRPGW
jgi:acyl-CoA synthetase (NDP forming)